MGQTVTAEMIGDTFAAMIAEDFSAEELAEVRRRNVTYGENVCATHDFCDANMTMLEAHRTHGVATVVDFDEETQPEEHEAACRLWGAAWAHAKAAHLTEKEPGQ